jgi:hypothetical protein
MEKEWLKISFAFKTLGSLPLCAKKEVWLFFG